MIMNELCYYELTLYDRSTQVDGQSFPFFHDALFVDEELDVTQVASVTRRLNYWNLKTKYFLTLNYSLRLFYMTTKVQTGLREMPMKPLFSVQYSPFRNSLPGEWRV